VRREERGSEGKSERKSEGAKGIGKGSAKRNAKASAKRSAKGRAKSAEGTNLVSLVFTKKCSEAEIELLEATPWSFWLLSFFHQTFIIVSSNK
jgi:hypothetical protein